MSGLSVGERVSIVVSPRQRWSLAESSLRLVIDRMPRHTQLIYVDGGAPAGVAENLKKLVAEVDGAWISRNCVLSGNEARNLGVPHADREFVVFVDNDLFPGEEWVERMVQCADATGAAVVGPLVFHGRSEGSRQIHIAGGEIAIENRVMVRNDRHFGYRAFEHVADQLDRRPTTQLELHCMMLRRDFVSSIFPFDEELRAFGDHEDIVLTAAQKGLGVWLEPTSHVTYVTMIPLDNDETGFWQLRWSEDWNLRSLRRFAEKWDIEIDKGWPEIAARWGTSERTRWYHGRGRIRGKAAKGFRLVYRSHVGWAVFRRLEERLMSRNAAAEIRRRVQVLGHD